MASRFTKPQVAHVRPVPKGIEHLSAKNIYHDVVVRALEADGWTITDDPLKLSYGGRNVFVDLGAERSLVAAAKGERRIAVEIQSFLNRSQVRDLEEAVGQYEIYRSILAKNEPDRALYLAVPPHVGDGILSEEFGRLVISSLKLKILVFDDEKGAIEQWIG